MVKSQKRKLSRSRNKRKKSTHLSRKRSIRIRKSKRHLDGGWKCPVCGDCNLNIYKKTNSCKECARRFWYRRHSIYTRGDGYCSLHAIYLSYLIGGGVPLYQEKVVLDPETLRLTIIDYINTNFKMFSSNDPLLAEELNQTRNDMIDITGKILKENSKVIIDNVNNVFFLMSNMFNIRIHFRNKVYRNQRYTNDVVIPYESNKDTQDVYVIGDNAHFSAVVSDIFTDFNKIPEIAQIYWENMVSDFSPSLINTLKLQSNFVNNKKL